MNGNLIYQVELCLDITLQVFIFFVFIWLLSILNLYDANTQLIEKIWGFLSCLNSEIIETIENTKGNWSSCFPEDFFTFWLQIYSLKVYKFYRVACEVFFFQGEIICTLTYIISTINILFIVVTK